VGAGIPHGARRGRGDVGCPREAAGVGNDRNSSDRAVHRRMACERSRPWGEQQPAEKHHLVRMRSEAHACFKEAGMDPGLE